MRGWRINHESNNNALRSSCITNSSCYIIGIAETHLLGNAVIHLDGDIRFGHKRNKMHRNAKTGSEGVGFVIKDTILSHFNVSTLL